MAAPGQGYNSYIALKKESVWGTLVQPDDFVEFTSEAVNQDEQWRTVPTISNSRYRLKRVRGSTKVEGAITFPMNVDDGIGLLLRDVLGSESYSALETGTVGQHIFTPQAGVGLTGLSLEVSRDGGNVSGSCWGFAGGHVRKLTISGEAGQDVVVNADIVFKSGVSGVTPQTPTYSTQLPLQFHTGTITVDTVAFGMKSFSITIDTGLRSERYTGSSRNIIQQVNGPLSITGQFVSFYDNLNEITKYINGTAAAISINIAGPTVGATPLGLTLAIPQLFYNKNLPVVGSMDEIFITSPFEAIKGVNDLITATLVNKVVSAY